MKTIFLLVVCFGFIFQTSHTLTCKNCNIHECDDSGEELCLEPGESQQVACLTESFTENLDSGKKVLYQRKCVLYDKDSEFECVAYPGYTTLSCVVCNKDLCNGATSVEVGKDGKNSTSVIPLPPAQFNKTTT